MRHVSLRSYLLSELTAGKNNNLNLLRLLAAFAVLASHSYALSTGSAANEPLRTTLGTSLGGFAVDVFFVISGFLVTGSLLRSASPSDFALARILRIFPGLWVAVLLTTLVLGTALTALNPGTYLLHLDLWKHLLRNCVIVFGVDYELPGLFDANPWPRAVNGSLWTLPYEVRMYLLLVLLWVLTAAGKTASRRAFQVLACVLGAAGLLYGVSGQLSTGQSHAFRLASVFFIGSMCWNLKGYIRISAPAILTLVAAVAVVVVLGGVDYLRLHFIVMPYLVLGVGYMPVGNTTKFNRMGDFSYGVYVYAFPIQQAIAHLIPGITPTFMTLASTAIVLPLSIVSWFLVEKPAMGMRNDVSAFLKKVRDVRSAREGGS